MATPIPLLLPTHPRYRFCMDLKTFHTIDQRLTRWMAEHGLTLLRVSIGLVFFWFGVLKFWPDLSPADDLAAATIDKLDK